MSVRARVIGSRAADGWLGAGTARAAFGGVDVRDADLTGLKAFGHLESLDVNSTAVTAAGLALLQGSFDLKSVIIDEERITLESHHDLAAAFPNCDIQISRNLSRRPRTRLWGGRSGSD